MHAKALEKHEQYQENFVYLKKGRKKNFLELHTVFPKVKKKKNQLFKIQKSL